MVDFLSFLQNNISAFWVVVIFAFLSFVAVVVIVYTQGREFKAGPIYIGARPASPSEHEITDEQLDDVSHRLAKRADEIKRETGNKEPWVSYRPAELPETTIEIFKAQTDIDNHLRRIVLEDGDGWAGSSLASGGQFFDIAQQFKLIDQKTIEDIQTFYASSIPYLYGIPMPDEQFKELGHLTFRIISDLERVIKNKK